ncbi:molybdopterin molybdotransferase MoeA [Thiolapillus brandeum]|uniref:Molybdopterin molybdenumtransferase n=1 Tax=Thiolapillus brandeum TaxID=1076588 RepID=A0A7U6GGA7_9GAMM|nr:gephyrin-like molybdotransferase Glp [Thiolapillus brandeum]BAO43076.1 molybdopterin biosynthesis protein MoeA [Thiolapillus brandeum]
MSGCDCTPSVSDLKPYEEAVELLLSHARPMQDTETLNLHDALGRVLAAPVNSGIDVPGWDNSAMDGYAVRTRDIPAAGTSLRISQRIPAGTAPQALEPGTAARIFTGAPVPEGADAVVMQELTCEQNGEVIINALPQPGAHIRRRGEDIRQNEEIIQPGVRLLPQHLGLAASVGVGQLQVWRRPRVAVLASGDELLMPGQPLKPGMIYNSNLFTLAGMLRALGCEVIDLGQVEDTLEATKAALTNAAGQADLVIASGGVSVGEEDHVKPAVEALGKLNMWKVAIRPGKPVAFGHIGDTPFLGTPGNPVSLFVTFLLFGRPFIRKLAGLSEVMPTTIQATAGFDWNKPDKRREFHRARLEKQADGSDRVSVHPSRSSAVLSSTTWANGLVVLPENQTIKTGDQVQFMPFSELLS